MAFLFVFLPFSICCPEPVENAYLQVFQQRASAWNLKYVVLELDVNLKDTAKLEEAIQAYCDENDITLLPDDYKWLVEEGYIERRETPGGMVDVYWNFEDGAFVTISGKKIGVNKLEIGVLMTPSVMTISGYVYEAKRVRSIWEITLKESWVEIV